MTQAARERASVERGDPLALRGLLQVGAKVDTRERVGASHGASRLARAYGPVADDPTRIAADAAVSDTDTHRENSAAMEHERQSRLRRWQTLGTQP